MPSHGEILGSLSHYDLVGFQTENDRDNFERYLVSAGAETMRNGALEMEGETGAARVFPVGIETAAFVPTRAPTRQHSPLARPDSNQPRRGSAHPGR